MAGKYHSSLLVKAERIDKCVCVSELMDFSGCDPSPNS